MLEQLPPKFKAIFFLFKENKKLFSSISIMQQLDEHNLEPIKASVLQQEQVSFFRDL